MEHLVGCFFAVLHSAHEPLSLGTPLRIYQEHWRTTAWSPSAEPYPSAHASNCIAFSVYCL